MKVCDVPEMDYFAKDDKGEVYDLIISILINIMWKYQVTFKSC